MKGLFFAAAIAVVAAMSFAATASADVPRYQPSATLTVALTDYPGYVHTFTITWTNPCGTEGAFVGTGHGSTEAGGADETITGTLVGDTLTFTAIYTSFIPGYTWTESSFAITWDVESIATYKNHGDYVNWAKEHAIAAKVAGPSCLGRPLPLSWSETGTVDSASLTGTTVLLPDAGTYRIDVSGTWDNGVWYDVDAEYVQQADLSWAQGWPGYPTVDFGDLMVNGSFVDWGAYSAAHTYSYTGHFSGSPLNLSVWDMWGDLVTDGHSDNVGLLNYAITYVGP